MLSKCEREFLFAALSGEPTFGTSVMSLQVIFGLNGKLNCVLAYNIGNYLFSFFLKFVLKTDVIYSIKYILTDMFHEEVSMTLLLWETMSYHWLWTYVAEIGFTITIVLAIA